MGSVFTRRPRRAAPSRDDAGAAGGDGARTAACGRRRRARPRSAWAPSARACRARRPPPAPRSGRSRSPAAPSRWASRPRRRSRWSGYRRPPPKGTREFAVSTVDRINELRAEAESAIAAAGDSAALEELRVRYLGPQVGADRDPARDRRAAGRRAWPGRVGRERRRARRSRSCSTSRSAELEGAELDRRLAEDAIDVTLPGIAARADGPPAPGHADPARDRGHLRRPRLPGAWTGPRSSTTSTTSPR